MSIINSIYQKLTRGYSDYELTELAHIIAKFILPRLKTYNDIRKSIPGNMTDDEWSSIIIKMINAFQLYIDSKDRELSKDEDILMHEGLEIFAKYFVDLWL